MPNDYADLLLTLSEIGQLTFQKDSVSFTNVPADPLPNSHVYEFPQIHYTSDYSKSFEKHRQNILTKPHHSAQHTLLLNRFIYVIGTNDEWRYFFFPQSVETCLRGRASVIAYPFHPVLAYDLDLRVAVAGEISFFWKKPNSSPEIIFINNVSGHFRPKDWLSVELDGKIRQILQLTSATSVISQANDGISISGPLSDKGRSFGCA